MKKPIHIPDCQYPVEPMLVAPSSPTPKRRLYLSNLDKQRFLRFSIKYLYVFRQAVPVARLRASLSALLVHYYPLAGRMITAETEPRLRLEVDCDGQGAVMAEAVIAEVSAEEFLQSPWPDKSWRKLLYRLDPNSNISTFLHKDKGLPLLLIQKLLNKNERGAERKEVVAED